jgi:plastocyanin
MSRQMQIVWAVVVVIILAGLYWWWSSSQSAMTANNTPTSQSEQPMIPATSTSSTGGTTSSAPMQATVTFDGSSFSPASVTIAQGGTVTWTSTNGDLWVASDPHPIHNGYDGTTLQQHCAPGYTGPAPFDECTGATSWSFTFDQVGTWGYHDHLDASIKASVTVVAAQ